MQAMLKITPQKGIGERTRLAAKIADKTGP